MSDLNQRAQFRLGSLCCTFSYSLLTN